MKLLSICIPTYNRNEELAELTQHFLVPALDAFSDLIEIVVCDNSDPAMALANQNVLDSRIQYRKNESNIGFAGNLLRCATEASSTFIWIISDDDPILWAGFAELMDVLPQHNIDGVDCVMLAFQTTNNFGDTVFSNRHTEWQVATETRMAALLRSGTVPFILFSSAVIRLDKSPLPELEAEFFNNDYLQVILFLAMLKADSPVRFITTSTIDYKPEYVGRFPISSLARSMTTVRDFLQLKYGVAKDEKGNYGSWLGWLMLHKSGLYRINNADNECWPLLAQLHHNMNIMNLMRALILVLPPAFFRTFYLGYKSYRDMVCHGNISFSELKDRYVTNRIFSEENMMGLP